MLTWDEVLARARPCLRCRYVDRIAGPFSSEGRGRVKEAWGRGLVGETFIAIRSDTGCGQVEAKATYMHLVKRAGECHWCRRPLPMAELIDCPVCKALNIML